MFKQNVKCKKPEYIISKSTTNRKIRLWRSLLTAITFLCIILFLYVWWNSVEKQAHIKPNYPMENINYLLQKDNGTVEGKSLEEDFLFDQTGLAPVAVDALFEQGRQQELLAVQENFFADVQIECSVNTIISREEKLVGEQAYIPYVENGDILISFNCHALGWRNGHAAIVVDAEKRLTLEARVLGSNSKILSMNHWESYPSFVVLRLKGASKEERQKIAKYAENYLVDVPYHLEAGIVEGVISWVQGIFPKEKEEENSDISGTHCAHLVWSAYNQFGYNLDSDGGLIVTPHDIYQSPHLEIIQIYGMPMDHS